MAVELTLSLHTLVKVQKLTVGTAELEAILFRDFSVLLPIYSAPELLRNYIADVLLTGVECENMLIVLIKTVFFRVICIREHNDTHAYNLAKYSRFSFVKLAQDLINSDEMNYTVETMPPQLRIANILLSRIIVTL